MTNLTRRVAFCTLLLSLVAAPAFAKRKHAVAGAAAAADADKVRVACIGDSITFGAGLKDRERECYPAQLQLMLGKTYEVENFGVNGATMLKKGDNPYWGQTAFRLAKEMGPNVVVIKLGTNDTKPQNWKYSEQFEADAREMVETLAALPSKPKVFLCHPVPAFPGNFGIRDEVIRNEVNPAIDKVAKATGATVIDLYALMADDKELFPDKVHPNADGAKIIAEAVRDAIAAGANKNKGDIRASSQKK